MLLAPGQLLDLRMALAAFITNAMVKDILELDKAPSESTYIYVAKVTWPILTSVANESTRLDPRFRATLTRNCCCIENYNRRFSSI